MKASYDTSVIHIDKTGLKAKKDTTLFTNWGYSKISDSAALKIEENRSDLLLENLHEALKKDIFRITTYPDFALGSPDSGVTWRRIRFSEFVYMKEHLSYVD